MNAVNHTDAVLRVAAVIPKGVGLGYSGPTVFLKRLVDASSGPLMFRIYAGEKVDHVADPDFQTPTRSMRADASPMGQVKWALGCLYWLWRDAGKFDVVHFHGTPFYALVPAVACIAKRLPYVLVPLAGGADMTETGKLSKFMFIRRLRRLIVARATGGLALSGDIAGDLQHLGMRAELIRPIQNPVSTDFFRPAGQRGDSFTVVFVGVMTPRKRPHLVLEALARIHSERGARLKALFVGPFPSDDSKDDFTRRAMELGVENHIEHVSYTEDVAGLLKQRRGVFVLPSSQEGLPGALCEAMAASYPAVVTDVGAMGTTVRAAQAGVVAEGNPTSLANALIELFNDEETWMQYSQNAYEYALTNFHPHGVATEYVESVQEVFNGKKGLA